MFKNNYKLSLLLFPILLLGQAIIKNNFAPIPSYNWDMFPYMSLVLELDGLKDDSLRHEKVYQLAKENMPWEHYHKNVSEENHYRHEMSMDYKGFEEQMTLYSIKPAYIASVYLLYKSGMDLVKASYFPSIISFYLIGWLLFFFMAGRINPIHALVVTLIFTLLPANLTASIMSTPDGLSALFTVTGFLILLKNLNNKWVFLLFILVLLTRRDMILFIGLLYLGLIVRAFLNKEGLLRRIIEMALICSAFLFIGIVFDSPSWKDLFIQSFAFKYVYFLSTDIQFLWSIYWDILDRIYIHLSNPFVVLLLLGSVIFFVKKERVRFIWKVSFIQFVFLVIFIVNIFRFFLFPDIHDRFYFVYYCLALILFVSELTEVKLGEIKP